MVLATLALGALSFADWAKQHGRVYSSKEELVVRRSVYAANVAKIAAHNAGNHGWTMEVNKFSDLTADEVKAAYASGGYKARKARTHVFEIPAPAALPASVDWVAKGAVTPVKDQGQCGSCWSFSAIAGIEGATFLATGKLLSLSEQELMDCSQKEGNQSCNGGLMDDAFQYVIDNKGIALESAYPYKAKDEPCNKAVQKEIDAKISSFKDVPENSETALMTAVAQQPVSVAVEADQASFQSYAGGVMTKPCGTNLDHGVTLVGYGTDATGKDYYTVKNSWGADWGTSPNAATTTKGYILLARGAAYNGAKGQCGIQMDPSYPVV
jgi:C1A family cysteine protease